LEEGIEVASVLGSDHGELELTLSGDGEIVELIELIGTITKGVKDFSLNLSELLLREFLSTGALEGSSDAIWDIDWTFLLIIVIEKWSEVLEERCEILNWCFSDLLSDLVVFLLHGELLWSEILDTKVGSSHLRWDSSQVESLNLEACNLLGA